MARQSKAQKETVERVMHEWKHGELTTPAGDKVTDRRQAVAIGLSEAGASSNASPAENKRNFRRTKREEEKGDTGRARAGGGATKAELYRRAREKDVPGRSTMSKAELAKAVS